MPFSIRKLTRLQFVAFGLMALLGLSTFAFSFRDWVSKPFIFKPTVPAVIVQTSADAPASSPIKSVLFTITSEGFEPNDITLPAGTYVIAVDNRSGSEDVQLVFSDGQSKKLKEQKLSRKQLDWYSVLALTPGKYSLNDVNHPNWSATIKVSPK